MKVSDWFKKKYMAEMKNDVQIAFAANAYDVATLVAKNFSEDKSRSLSAEEILSKLEHVFLENSAHGSFVFSKTEQYGKTFLAPLILRQIINGEIKDLQH